MDAQQNMAWYRYCCFSIPKSCLTLHDPMDYSTPGSSVFTISQSLPKCKSTESMMLPNHLIFCHCLLLLPSIFPSFKVFSNELALHIWWPKCWSFTISSSNEHSGLISLRIDWFNFLLVQRILKALLQHPNLKASVLWCSAFSMIQLSHPYMTTGKKTQLWL